MRSALAALAVFSFAGACTPQDPSCEKQQAAAAAAAERVQDDYLQHNPMGSAPFLVQPTNNGFDAQFQIQYGAGANTKTFTFYTADGPALGDASFTHVELDGTKVSYDDVINNPGLLGLNATQRDSVLRHATEALDSFNLHFFTQTGTDGETRQPLYQINSPQAQEAMAALVRTINENWGRVHARPAGYVAGACPPERRFTGSTWISAPVDREPAEPLNVPWGAIGLALAGLAAAAAAVVGLKKLNDLMTQKFELVGARELTFTDDSGQAYKENVVICRRTNGNPKYPYWVFRQRVTENPFGAPETIEVIDEVVGVEREGRWQQPINQRIVKSTGEAYSVEEDPITVTTLPRTYVELLKTVVDEGPMDDAARAEALDTLIKQARADRTAKKGGLAGRVTVLTEEISSALEHLAEKLQVQGKKDAAELVLDTAMAVEANGRTVPTASAVKRRAMLARIQSAAAPAAS